jgi:tight adherence protein B
MEFGGDLSDLAFMALVAIAVGGLAIAVVYPILMRTKSTERVAQIAEGRKEVKQNSFRSRFVEDQKDTRRKQIQESLSQIGEEQKKRKKKLNLRNLIAQAGLDMSPNVFWMMSVVLGVAMTVVPLFLGIPWFVCAGAGFVGLLGLPRWFLGALRRRRQNVFLHDFADAIDVMVRALKAGLPVSEAMKIISTEQGPPVGPEFLEVVEGQRLGISIEQGIERMVERMPLSEVNFLAIVMTIQSKTGGNLSEALSNLSRVLRDRKKMKQKITSVSQEAKSSAAIIGSLPFIIMGMLTIMNPNYLNPMFNTSMGNMLLVGSGIWMTLGILVMRKMINFEI